MLHVRLHPHRMLMQRFVVPQELQIQRIVFDAP